MWATYMTGREILFIGLAWQGRFTHFAFFSDNLLLFRAICYPGVKQRARVISVDTNIMHFTRHIAIAAYYSSLFYISDTTISLLRARRRGLSLECFVKWNL
jgi:hypothetical protein